MAQKQRDQVSGLLRHFLRLVELEFLLRRRNELEIQWSFCNVLLILF